MIDFGFWILDFGFWIEEDFGLKISKTKKGTRPFDRVPSVGEEFFKLVIEDRA